MARSRLFVGARYTSSLLAFAGLLLVAYLPALQTIPNGGEHYFMIDVGETQIVLNTWGTLHATGYPLYVMTGGALVGLFRWLGVPPAAAPALVSLLWGMLALAVVFSVQRSVLGRTDSKFGTRSLLPALLATLLLGLTRTVWIHMAIAEIYSFGLLILALLLAVALWPRPIRGRIYWLAFLGGIGVFHHRALLLAAPALVYAVWPELVRGSQLAVVPARNSKRWTRLGARLLLCLLLGLLGFVPYAYLPLRANAGAAWVYGQPGTWSGFWDQFFGREAERFIGAPDSLDALLANAHAVNTVLLTDLTAPGLLAGAAGLALALRNPARRRAAVTLILSAAAAYGFHVALYTDILSALILPVTVSTAFGWAFLGNVAGERLESVGMRRWLAGVVLAGAALAFGAALYTQNQPFISRLTRDTTGLETISLVDESAPTGSTVMLAWGPRYFAAAFAKDVQGRLPQIQLADHRADFAAILNSGRTLVTPAFTFYNQPVRWWEARLGAPVYLSAAAPYLVQIKTQPEMAAAPPDGVSAVMQQIECRADKFLLRVAWADAGVPARDLSVFVHLLDAAGAMIAQGDQAAPVYGWRPMTTWAAGELVRDVYVLPREAGAAGVRFGLYYQAASGEFVNEVEYELPVDCP